MLLENGQSKQHLELNWYPPNSSFASEYVPGEGLDHIGFIVNNVKEKLQELVSNGGAPTEVDPSRTGGLHMSRIQMEIR